MANKVIVSQLGTNVPIVDPKTGKPTAQFIQQWAKQLLHNANGGGPSDAADMSAELDLISDTQGDVLIRGADGWEGSLLALANLEDVDTSGEIDGYVLTYDAASGKWLAKVSTGGGGGGGGGPHRFWAIDIDNWNDGSYQGISNMEWRLTVGGAQAAVGGIGSSPRGAQAGATADIFTGAGNWTQRGVQYAGDSRTTLIIYDMGAGRTLADIKEIAMSPDPDTPARGPYSFTLLYSDNGTDWSVRSRHYPLGWSAVGQIKTFEVPAASGGGGGGGSTTLAALTDVHIPSPTGGQVLTFDATTSKWLAETPAGPPSVITSTKWRLVLDATNNGNANTGFNAVGMCSTIGGPIVTPTSVSVDTTSYGSSANLPLMSASNGSFWVAPTGTAHTIEYDFATAIAVEEVQIIMAQDGTGTSGPLCWPISITIQYWDGTAWQTHWVETGLHPTPNTTVPIVYDNVVPVTEPALVELSDVNISAPADKQVVTWDAATSKWLAKTPTGGGGGGGAGAATAFTGMPATGQTSGNFATACNRFRLDMPAKIAGLQFNQVLVAGAVYQIGYAPWDPTALKMTGPAVYCDTIAIDIGNNLATGAFSAPVDCPIGEYIVMLVRTDAGTTPPITVGYNGSTAAVVGYGVMIYGGGGGGVLASIAPATTDVWPAFGGNPFGCGVLIEPDGLGSSGGGGSAYVTPNIVQEVSIGDAGGGSLSPFAIAAPTVGNALLVAIATWSSAAITLPDSTWTLLHQNINSDACIKWYFKIADGTEGTSLNFNAGDYHAIGFWELDGLDAFSTFDDTDGSSAFTYRLFGQPYGAGGLMIYVKTQNSGGGATFAARANKLGDFHYPSPSGNHGGGFAWYTFEPGVYSGAWDSGPSEGTGTIFIIFKSS